jgi:hypothetical protein
MIAPSGTRGFPWHAHGRAALMAAIVMAAAGCGGGDTSPTPVTTTSSIATTSTTSVATTTTSSTATTSTTTTSIPALSGSFRVENTPCIANSSGSVSCRFIATATGGTPSYTFDWRFVGPTNNSATPSGQQVDPVLGCDIAAGVATFNVNITLTITDAARSTATVTGSQQITRAAGACGT